jgi:hypothetical protein
MTTRDEARAFLEKRAFAGVLDTWASAADARADEADRSAQPDLFGERTA